MEEMDSTLSKTHRAPKTLKLDSCTGWFKKIAMLFQNHAQKFLLFSKQNVAYLD